MVLESDANPPRSLALSALVTVAREMVPRTVRIGVAGMGSRPHKPIVVAGFTVGGLSYR